MIARLNAFTVSKEISSCGVSYSGSDSEFYSNENMDYGYLVTNMFTDYDIAAKIKLLVAISIEMYFGDYLQGVIIDNNKLILKLTKVQTKADIAIREYEILNALEQIDYFNFISEVFENEGFKIWSGEQNRDIVDYLYECFVYSDNITSQDYNYVSKEIYNLKLPYLFDYAFQNIGKHNGEYFYFDPLNFSFFEVKNNDIDIKDILISYNIPFVKIY